MQKKQSDHWFISILVKIIYNNNKIILNYYLEFTLEIEQPSMFGVTNS